MCQIFFELAFKKLLEIQVQSRVQCRVYPYLLGLVHKIADREKRLELYDHLARLSDEQIMSGDFTLE